MSVQDKILNFLWDQLQLQQLQSAPIKISKHNSILLHTKKVYILLSNPVYSFNLFLTIWESERCVRMRLSNMTHLYWLVSLIFVFTITLTLIIFSRTLELSILDLHHKFRIDLVYQHTFNAPPSINTNFKHDIWIQWIGSLE